MSYITKNNLVFITVYFFKIIKKGSIEVKIFLFQCNIYNLFFHSQFVIWISLFYSKKSQFRISFKGISMILSDINDLWKVGTFSKWYRLQSLIYIWNIWIAHIRKKMKQKSRPYWRFQFYFCFLSSLISMVNFVLVYQCKTNTNTDKTVFS